MRSPVSHRSFSPSTRDLSETTVLLPDYSQSILKLNKKMNHSKMAENEFDAVVSILT